MQKVDPLINSLNGGEISPKLDARADLQKYANSCRVMENFIPMVEGGAFARPGLYYVAELKDSSKKGRLFPFQYSTVQPYVVCAEDSCFRFFKDNGQIVGSYAAWSTSTAYALGALVTNSGSYYRCLVAHTSGTFATDLAAGKWVVTGGATDLAYEIPSVYAEDDLYNIKTTQSADVLYMANRDYNIKKLSRSAHTTWTLSDFISVNKAALTITGASQANPCVITTSGTISTISNGAIVYLSGIGGMTELNGKFFTVAGLSGATFQLSGINSSGYSAYTSGGTAQPTQFGTTGNNPGAIGFFEQRLMAGGTDTNPLNIYGSVSSSFEDFTQDATDDSAALQYSLLSDKVDSINWLMGEEYLMIGTSGGVWRMGASSTSNPLTASDVVAKRQLANGVMDIDAEMVNDAILYVQRGGTTIRKATWEWTKDKYVGLDVTRIAKHITKGATAALSGITDMDYQSEPVSMLWCVRADGTLLGMVYEPDENIYPWFRITTDGEFESVATITKEGEEDQVWVIVKRTINGATKRYVEYFKPHDFFNVYSDAFFVDSGLTWEGAAAVDITAISNASECVITAANSLANGNKVKFRDTGTWLDDHVCTVSDRAAGSFKIKDEDGTAYIDSTGFATYTAGSGTVEQVAKTLSGIGHLEGESVAVLTDQGKHANVTVASGAITLSFFANKISVGLPYNYNLQPMKIEAGTQEGTSRGRKKKIYGLSVSFYQSAGVQWGADDDNLQDVPFGDGGQPVLFTGEKQTDFDGDYSTDASIYIRGASPLPCAVLSISPKLVMTDG